MSIHANAFAASHADWLCVECWIARHAIERGVGGCGASVRRSERGRRTRREHVFADFFLRTDRGKFPAPEAEEGAGGREAISRPPFPFFDRVIRRGCAHAVERRHHTSGGAGGLGRAVSALSPGGSG